MILQALHQLSKDECLVDAIDYFWRNVAWIIDVRADGSIKCITDHRRDLNAGVVDKKGKPLPPKMAGRPMYCPTQFYRSGSKAQPHFLVDTARYVFGKDDEIAPERAIMLAEMFRDRIAQCAVDTGNKAVQAVVKCLDRYRHPAKAPIPEDLAKGDMFAFRYDHYLVHSVPVVMTWWKLEQAKEDVGDGDYQCLVTGKRFSKVPLFPKTSGVPGSSQDIKLISCDKPSYSSHGWVKNENAPICREAGIHVGASLTRLLSKEPRDAHGTVLPLRHIRIPGNIALCYWAHDPTELETRILNDFWHIVMGRPKRQDGTDVDQEVLDVWAGKTIEMDEPAIVYMLGISGAMGRATIRSWNETTVPELLNGLAQHFTDLSIVRSAKSDKEPVIPFHRLVESLTSGEGRNPTVPVGMEVAIIQAAITGSRYPSSIPGHVVRRVRAEIGKTRKDTDNQWARRARMDARMALLKAYLNRRRRTEFGVAARYPEIKPQMDPTIEDAGYRLGVMLAIMERIQQAAAGGRKVNCTIIDRYFGAASTTPRGTFNRLLRSVRHHVFKAQRGDKLSGVMARRCSRMLGALVAKFDPAEGIPTRLSVEGQSLFMLGYYQMQCWLYMNRDDRDVWEQRYAGVADPSFIWPKPVNGTDANTTTSDAPADDAELVDVA